MNPPDFRALVRRQLPGVGAAAPDSDVVDELATLLEDAYASARADGASEQEAWQQVQAQLRRDGASWQQLDDYLGRVATPPTAGAATRVWRAGWLEGWTRDLRHAVRTLVRDGRFTIPVALTLIVCIGVNAAVFTIVNAVLLRPLPFPDSERVVLMAGQGARAGNAIRSDIPSYFDRRQRLTVFDEMAMFRWIDVSIDTASGPQRVRGDVGTASLLPLIGVPPLHGRLFDDRDEQAGAAQKVILSYGLWQELYAGDPAAVGTDLRLDGRPFRIVGVMPQGFGIFRLDARLWIPAVYGDAERADTRRGWANQYQIGRLKDGATLDDARRELAAFDASELARFSALPVVAAREGTGFHTSVDPLQDVMTRDVRPTLELIWVGALLLLAVGIVNTASLTIARVRRNAREMATRMALGARRWHIVRQLLAEGLLLGAAGGVGGLALGAGLMLVLPRVGLTAIPRAEGIQMDVTGMLSTLAAGAVAGLLIGVAPGAGAASADLSRRIRSQASRIGNLSAAIARRALVTAQVAIAFVLMATTGLLGLSFWRLLHESPGFATENVLTASFDLPATRYPAADDARQFVTRSLDAIRQLPGVISAGTTQLLPFGGREAASSVRRGDPSGNDRAVIAWSYVISPGYLETMRIPLRGGRHFDERDTAAGARVVIIDDALARRLWPDGGALGQKLLWLGAPERTATIVGIAGAVRHASLDGPGAGTRGAVYRPHAQASERAYALAIRTASSASVMPAVRRAVAELDPDLPLYDVRVMSERVYATLAPRSLALTLATVFGSAALLLATVGIYGVLNSLAMERRRECGIRLALGSSVRGVVWLVAREGAYLTAGGLILGFAGVLWVQDRLAAYVYGVTATDPSALGASAAVVTLLAALACLTPARRVARVAPAVVLEQE